MEIERLVVVVLVKLKGFKSFFLKEPVSTVGPHQSSLAVMLKM